MQLNWAADEYAALEDSLRRHAGLIFQSLRRQTVEDAAVRVMRRIGIVSPALFLPLVQHDGAVFDDLMAEVTVGETYFFREAAHFRLLRETILPEFRERRAARDQKLRVWSAGASTGEEAYSIAIALSEQQVPGFIIGTDVSRARLAAARRGQYRRWSFRGVPESVIDRYFRREPNDTFTLVPSVRREVEFRYLNLAADCYPSMSTGVWGLDVIFCRNVLIYFDRETIARVAKALLASLADDGWILLGATDPPLSDYVECEVLQGPHGLAYRRRSATRRNSQASGSRMTVVAVGRANVAERGAPSATNAAPPVTGSAATEEASSGIARAKEAAPDVRPPTPPAVAASIGRDSAASAAALVRDLANAGHLEDAGRACAAALDHFRDSPELHYLHAILLAHAGHYAESARAAKRAIYLDRTMVVAHIALGTAMTRSGQAAGARRSLATATQLLERMPANADVPYTSGEPAARLLEMTRLQAQLLKGDSA